LKKALDSFFDVLSLTSIADLQLLSSQPQFKIDKRKSKQLAN
ncbi:MAG: iron-responsive transcriptional regulator RirA, partial [Bartonella sp.]|nr:iron-responsive transcriptional regulator RirA [Bartonella sp.]